MESIDSSVAEAYTRLTDNWQARNLEAVYDEDTDDVVTRIRAVYEAVVAAATADMTPDETQLVVDQRNTSLKYADWLVGELRSRGLPARVVLGVSLSDGQRLSDARPHAWAEGYAPGIGWMTLDPWQGIYNHAFGTADPLRVALAVWGIEDNRPPVDLNIATLSYTDNPLEPIEPSPNLVGRKHMILPGLSIVSVTSQRQAGGIIDSVELQTQQQTLSLGSQAPFETATVRYLALGLSAFKAESASLGTNTNAVFQPWIQDATVTLNYWPMIGLLSLILVSGIGRWLWRRRQDHGSGSARRAPKPSKETLTLHDEATGDHIEDQDLITPTIAPPPVVRPSQEPPPPAQRPPEPRSPFPPRRVQ
jgi:hypothetical protein